MGNLLKYQPKYKGSMLDSDHKNGSKGWYCAIYDNSYTEWDKDEFTFRTEYVHSQGWGVSSPGSGNTTIDYSKGDKADGWYVFGIVPVIKSKLHAKARYQCYRPQKNADTQKTMYEVGANYFINKNLEITAEYARVNDRSLAPGNHDYNFVDVEFDFRF